jgi:hypothetical protein
VAGQLKNREKEKNNKEKPKTVPSSISGSPQRRTSQRHNHKFVQMTLEKYWQI